MLIVLKKEVADKGLPERLLLQIKHYQEQIIASQQLCNSSVVFRKLCKSDTLIGITWPLASGKTKPCYNSIHDLVGVSKEKNTRDNEKACKGTCYYEQFHLSSNPMKKVMI